MAKRDGRQKPKAGGKEPEASVPLYPSARLLRAEKPTKEVEIVELVSDDERSAVLAYYKNVLSEQGWAEFASHNLDDRGTLSFRHAEHGTITVLAASEADSTHIRIYLKK